MTHAENGNANAIHGLLRMWARRHLATVERHGWNLSGYLDPLAYLEKSVLEAILIYENRKTGRVSDTGDGFLIYLLNLKRKETAERVPDSLCLFPKYLWPD